MHGCDTFMYKSQNGPLAVYTFKPKTVLLKIILSMIYGK